MKRNLDMRKKAKENGIKLWEIAEKLNLKDFTFSRTLRKELSKTEKAKIMRIIDELKGGEK